jgi:NADH-quinone oxidoreductase subunit J
MKIDIDFILLVFTAIAALWTVVGRSLLKATIGLAVTSTLISILMFRLNSPLAAMFELSVCTGLITAVFVSTISLTKPLTHKEILQISKDRIKRYWYLPVMLVVIGIALMLVKVKQDFVIAPPAAVLDDVRTVLWSFRRLDLLGQVIILLAGAIGIVILFGEKKNDKQ